MIYSICFIGCVVMGLVNLPFVLQEGDSIFNLCSMILCGALAVWSLIMAIIK